MSVGGKVGVEVAVLVGGEGGAGGVDDAEVGSKGSKFGGGADGGFFELEEVPWGRAEIGGSVKTGKEGLDSKGEEKGG